MDKSERLDKCLSLKAIICDCDGVLTPGDLLYDATGNRLLRFHVRDGLGIAMLANIDIRIAILSGRSLDIARKHFSLLGVQLFTDCCTNKKEGFEELCRQLNLSPQECAYIGDDHQGGCSQCLIGRVRRVF